MEDLGDDRKGVKCAANLDPSDGGQTFTGGRVEGRGGATDEDASIEGVIIITVRPLPKERRATFAGGRSTVDFLAGAATDCSADFFLPRNGNIERRDLDVKDFSDDEGVPGSVTTAFFGECRDPCVERKKSARSDVFTRGR